MVLLGIPLTTLETLIGQGYLIGPVQLLNRLAPWPLRGLGISMITLALCWTAGYGVLLSWMLHYVALAVTVQQDTSGTRMNQTMPWLHCGSTWNTKQSSNSKPCIPDIDVIGAQINGTWGNCNPSTITKADLFNQTSGYEFNRALVSGNVRWMGTLWSWHNLVYLALVWLCVAFLVRMSIRKRSTLVYTAAFMPALFLIPFTLLAVALPTGVASVKTYFVPYSWYRLLELPMWVSAGGQVLLSLNIATGGLVTLASFNKQRFNPFTLVALIFGVESCIEKFDIFIERR